MSQQHAQGVKMFSVVVAVRNAETTLRETLDCLINQSSQDFQLVLIDGASTDGTLAVATPYRARIDCLVSEPDDGIADAWNKGLARATGDWILFLNAGDLIHPDHLLRAARLISRQPEPAVLFCDVIKFNSEGTITTNIKGRAPTRASIQIGGLGFGHPGSVAHTSIFSSIGRFDTALRIAIDSDWLLRTYNAGFPFVRLESQAYMAEGGISDRQFGRAMAEFFQACERIRLITPAKARIMLRVLPLARSGLHIYRRLLHPFARSYKHQLVAALNLLIDLIFLHKLRKPALRTLGFVTGKESSISVGFRFYRTGNIKLGDHSVINRNCLLDNRAAITIGDNVSIARDVKIFTGGHDPHSPFFEMYTAPVTIGDHVVIFAGASIMPGVKIGVGAVIHSGAVVTRNVESMTIVGGVPARPMGIRRGTPLYKLKYPFPLAM